MFDIVPLHAFLYALLQVFLAEQVELHNVEYRKRLCGRSGSEAGRSAVVAWTVRTCAESVRVPSFSQDLLAKTTGLARETTCSRSSPPLYIDEGLQPIEPQQSIKSSLFLILLMHKE
jgi:hypothetical protein